MKWGEIQLSLKRTVYLTLDYALMKWLNVGFLQNSARKRQVFRFVCSLSNHIPQKGINWIFNAYGNIFDLVSWNVFWITVKECLSLVIHSFGVETEDLEFKWSCIYLFRFYKSIKINFIRIAKTVRRCYVYVFTMVFLKISKIPQKNDVFSNKFPRSAPKYIQFFEILLFFK